MRNNYILLGNMPIIDFELAKNIITGIDREIKSLKHDDLKTENGFDVALKKLHQKVDLKPVLFSEPEIVNHRIEEKQIAANYYSPMGGNIQTNIITVKVGFSGSYELFKYRPNGFEYRTSVEPVVYQPSENAIYLDIEHANLGDREGVLKEVERHMNVTYSTILSNNKYIGGLSAELKSSVTQKLTKYKEDLDNLYK